MDYQYLANRYFLIRKLKLTRKKLQSLNALNDDNYEKVVKLAFQHKRKTLKNNFKGILEDSDFIKMDIEFKIK